MKCDGFNGLFHRIVCPIKAIHLWSQHRTLIAITRNVRTGIRHSLFPIPHRNEMYLT